MDCNISSLVNDVGSAVADEGLCTFRCGEMNDIAIGFEHVNFLNPLDGLHIHLLQCRLHSADMVK